MRRSFTALALALALLSGIRSGSGVEETAKTRAFSLEERVFELKLGRRQSRGGNAAMIALLQEEHARLPRPWTKGWLGNASINHKDFNCERPLLEPEVAWKMLCEAGEEGCITALMVQATALLNGMAPGRGPDHAEGARLAILAAEAGSPIAMVTASHCLFFGKGVPRDTERALALARRAGNATVIQALEFIAQAYLKGEYGTPMNRPLASRLYFEAASHRDNIAPATLVSLAKDGVPDAEKYLYILRANFLREGSVLTNSEVKRTVAWLVKNHPEDPEALVAAGIILIDRRFHAYDPKEAQVCFKKALAKGSDDAAFFLATMKLHGIGMRTDEKGALEELRILADKGHAKALAKLGWAYYWGPYKQLGAGKNPEKAFELALRAAELGDWFGLLNVGHCYKHGIGVAASPDLAYWYYGLAGTAGSAEGREEEGRLRPFLKD